NDQVIGTATADQFGFFELILSTTSPKGTLLTVTATDSSGNTSNPTTVKVVSSVAPVIPTVDPVFDTSAKVSGHADPFDTITIFAGKSKLGTVQSGADGTFSVSIRKQAVGKVLTVTATDVISRMSTAKLTVQDGTPPAIPTVNTVTSTSTKVTGTAEKDATITITVGDKIYTGTVDRYGRFVITIDKQAKGTVLSVTATDKSNNTSKPKLVTVR
ncbi:MAG: Ig-like domain-containing protein, partial [Tumebacillaceae bacterium]